MGLLWNKIVQYFVPPVDKSGDPERECHASPPVTRSELYVPTSVIDRYDARQHEYTVQERKRGRIDCWRLTVEVSTLVFAILGFWVLYRTLAATERNFRLDQRAWIDVSVEGKGVEIAENRPLRFVVRIKNTGKTLARDFEHCTAVTIVPSNQPPDFSSGFPCIRGTTGMVTPNKSFDVDVSMLSREKSTIIDPIGVTKAEIEDLGAGRAYIAIFGKATYRDIYSVPHWVRFCTARAFATGEYYAQQCTEYNDADNNE